MYGKIIIDGNAFYEIDEECIKRKEAMEREQENKEGQRKDRQ